MDPKELRLLSQYFLQRAPLKQEPAQSNYRKASRALEEFASCLEKGNTACEQSTISSTTVVPDAPQAPAPSSNTEEVKMPEAPDSNTSASASGVDNPSETESTLNTNPTPTEN